MSVITRRTFLKFGAGFGATLGFALAGTPVWAGDKYNYTPASLQVLQQSGVPFLIDFYTDWCSTCHAQERAILSLQSGDARYDAIPILRVDWDIHSHSDLAISLAIPRRSTLVIMKGENELGRVVAQTSKTDIARLLDLAL
jgi:thioredoxin 1